MATARQEWAAMWPLPVVSMLGYAGNSCFAYSSGVFMIYMTRDFGWSRTEFSTAFLLQTVVGFFLMPLVGRLVDRFGPRRVALVGILPVIAGFFLLSLANGSIQQWWLLCMGQAMLCSLVAPTVWLTEIASRFTASRGLALATALSGTGVASASWPFLAAHYIDYFGWRMAFPALAASWVVLMLPLLFLFFGTQGRGEPAPVRSSKPRVRIGRRLLSRTFLCIAISGGLFSSVSFGMTLHLVPILEDRGFTLATAAEFAVMAGIFAIIGRLTIGYLLDILPTRPLALAVFLLPLIVSLLLWNASGSVALAIVAVAIVGFATGAETDIVMFMLARQFEPGILGSVYGITLAVFAACASLGPILAGALFDHYGSYNAYLMVVTVPVLVGAALLWSMGTMQPAEPHVE